MPVPSSPATAFEIRPPLAGEPPRLLTLNNAEVPQVSGHDPASWRALLAMAERTLVAVRAGELAGFLVAFGPGANYESPNYRWFAARERSFLYIDRVVVAPAHRRTGVAALLYAAAAAGTHAARLTCEVNRRPRNDASLAFHTTMGFAPVGEQDVDGGTKTVVMLARDLQPGRTTTSATDDDG